MSLHVNSEYDITHENAYYINHTISGSRSQFITISFTTYSRHLVTI